MKERVSRGWRIYCLFCFVLTIFIVPSAMSKQSCSNSFTVGSGRVDGRYYEFVNKWAEYENAIDNGICISNRLSKGSVDNLNLIQRTELDAALVQGDIGNHAFYGMHGYEENTSFAGLKLLYREYVQIVYLNKNGFKLNTLSDLQGKTIAAGTKGSGGYWNAVDLLTSAGLQEGIHFVFFESTEHPVDSLLSSVADVAIYTSAGVHQKIKGDQGNAFRFMALPENTAKVLSVGLKKPYYDHGKLTYSTAAGLRHVMSVAVHAYLVVSDKLNSAAVIKMRESVDNYLSYLGKVNSRIGGDLLSVNDIKSNPFEMHALSSYVSQNSLLRFIIKYGLISAMIAIVVGVLYFRFAFKSQRYSSIGIIKHDTLSYWFKQRLAKVSKYVIGFAFWFIWLVVIALVIAKREELFAAAQGIESPLDGFTLLEKIIWLLRTSFTTLPGEIPLSMASSILIPATVIFGLGAFIYPAIKYYNAVQADALKRDSGHLDRSNWTDHVLICGWNERAKGVILSLISEYTPITKRVVVVAEIDGETPLVALGFDPRRVAYIRGNAADTSVLRRAGACHASEAIVLSCSRNAGIRNINSILTVVALHKLAEMNNNHDFFICAELIHPENEEAFRRAGVNSLVNVNQVLNKTSAINALSAGLADFVIDFLTFDNHFEIYSKRISQFPNKFRLLAQSSTENGLATFNIQRLRQMMVAADFQLLGVSKTEENTARSQFNLMNEIDKSEECALHDRLIYFSEHKNRVKKTKWQSPVEQTGVNLPNLAVLQDSKHVLVIGEQHRAQAVCNLLDSINVNTLLIDLSEFVLGIAHGKDSPLIVQLYKMDSVLVLEPNSAITDTKQTEQSLKQESWEHSAAVLIVKYLADIRSSQELDFQIVAETNTYQDRELFSISGANDVIVRNFLVERLLAKMVFNHGKMYEIVSQLLTLDDGLYLVTHVVEENDFFVGKDIRSLLLGHNKTYQVCGWLPTRLEHYLKQNRMGTAVHWVTALNSDRVIKEIKQNPYIEVGDKLALVKFN